MEIPNGPLFETGARTIRLSSGEEYTVRVQPRPATFTYGKVQLPQRGYLNAPIEIKAEVTNLGSFAGETRVELAINGEIVAAQELLIEAGPGGVSETVVFHRRFDEPGSYEVKLGGASPAQITGSGLALAREWKFKKGIMRNGSSRNSMTATGKP